MNLKNWLRNKIIFPIVEMLPRNLRNSLKMAGSCCFGKGWDYFYLSFFTEEFKDLTAEDVKACYSELSPHSREVLLAYLKYCHLSYEFCKHLNTNANDSIIVPVGQLFPGLKEKSAFEEKMCRKLARKTCFDSFSPESGYYHHGLKLLSAEIQRYIKGTVFLDLGAFIGDSAFVMSKYAPGKIISLEPSAENCSRCRENLIREKIDSFEIIQAGVSDSAGEMSLTGDGSRTSLGEYGGGLVKVVTVDDFMKQHGGGKVGVIKADLEGMGLKMLKGAIETVKRDRPVLLLAIYHNQDEFMGIYKFLKENVSGYHYQVEALAGICEVTLIAWPEEAEQA